MSLIINTWATRDFVSSDLGNVTKGDPLKISKAFYEHLLAIDCCARVALPGENSVITHPDPIKVPENKMQKASQVAPEKKNSVLSKVAAKLIPGK